MLTQRRTTRQIRIGSVPIGGDAPISVQSMTTTKTADINATLQQIASLVAAGVDIVRVAVPHWEDAEALTAIAAKSTVPVVADIHFQWKYAMAALEAGIQGLRINPGNIKYQDKVRLIAREAKARGVPIRIGVNAGSLEKDLLEKYGAPDARGAGGVRAERGAHPRGRGLLRHQDLREALEPARDDRGVPACSRRSATTRCTSASPRRGRCPTGGVKSAVGIGALLAEGIGDTIRVSLTDDPVEEVKAGTLDPAVARAAQARARPGGLPVVRPGRGRRARPDQAGQRGAREGGPQGRRSAWPSWAAS